MYRMFLSFQNLDGNIYTWNLYVWRFLNMWNPHAAHGARMGQLLLVVAFTDGDYQRLEGEGRTFSLRDDSMDSSKNGGLSMKSCGLMGLIITNGGFSNFKY